MYPLESDEVGPLIESEYVGTQAFFSRVVIWLYTVHFLLIKVRDVHGYELLLQAHDWNWDVILGTKSKYNGEGRVYILLDTIYSTSAT